MTAGGARRGRRDNGLDAADFAVAGDVDPRVGEHLLDVLQAAGIAAYLQPTADLNPILRATTLPSRPTDRLYVDRTQLEAARTYLNKVTGGQPPTPPPDPTREPDIESEWAKIVAGFHTPVDPTATPWPSVEDLPAAPEPPPPATEPVEHNRRRSDRPAETAPEPTLLDGVDTFGAETDDDEDEDEDRFIPPPPPPLPHISKYAIIGVLAVLVGFVVFVFPGLIPIQRDYSNLIGFAAIVSGAVMLVWRLRSGDDDEDDFDDGAVV
ncbi:hypothetical protein [Paractinoplanes globisporus]|uniref:DUF308 domain-containing protein n=1 Tax=Paractinoplanes globisporus TaxID=113565 RepID=A0ABW6WHN3_9ACTN|nr:hypothetical protein [Actinoplanes globisporus]